MTTSNLFTVQITIHKRKKYKKHIKQNNKQLNIRRKKARPRGLGVGVWGVPSPLTCPCPSARDSALCWLGPQCLRPRLRPPQKKKMRKKKVGYRKTTLTNNTNSYEKQHQNKRSHTVATPAEGGKSPRPYGVQPPVPHGHTHIVRQTQHTCSHTTNRQSSSVRSCYIVKRAWLNCRHGQCAYRGASVGRRLTGALCAQPRPRKSNHRRYPYYQMCQEGSNIYNVLSILVFL
jgi:hypothetical protein